MSSPPSATRNMASGGSSTSGTYPSTSTDPQRASSHTTTKPLNLVSAVFGECLCSDAFQIRDKSRSPADTFVSLDGIECIALGAVVDEHTPRQRVDQTVRQLSTRQERLISIGYLLGDSPSAPSVSGKVFESIPLEVYEKTFPNDSLPKNILSLILHLKRNDFAAATKELEAVLRNQRAHRGSKDNKFKEGLTLHNIAVVNLLAGKDDVALPLFQEAAMIKKEAFGSDHQIVAVSLDEVGILLVAQGKFDEALAVFNDARRIREQSLGSNNPKVAMVLNNIACTHFLTGNPISALAIFQEAIEIQQVAMGSSAKADLDLLHVATTQCNLGYMKLRLKKYDEALAIFEEALLIQQSVLGDNHKMVTDTISNIHFANGFHS